MPNSREDPIARLVRQQRQLEQAVGQKSLRKLPSALSRETTNQRQPSDGLYDGDRLVPGTNDRMPGTKQPPKKTKKSNKSIVDQLLKLLKIKKKPTKLTIRPNEA